MSDINVTITEADPINVEFTGFTQSASETGKAKVSSNDTTLGYLNGKLIQGTGITLSEQNDGGNETLEIACSLDLSDYFQNPAVEDLDLNGKNIILDEDGDTYLKLSSDNQIHCYFGGVDKVRLISSYWYGTIAGSFALKTSASSSTLPVHTFAEYVFYGLGGEPENGFVSIIANQKEGIRVAEDSGIAALHLPEITTPTAIADFGAIYTKADNKLYFQDGAGVEHEVAFV